MKVRRRLFYGGFLIISLIAVIVLLLGIHQYLNVDGTAGTRLFITSLGVFGTLVLAAATFLSVRQNIHSVNEMEREREKPIVKDEILKVIQPAIDALKGNVERMESDYGPDWIYSDSRTYNPGGETDRVSSVFADPAPVAMARLQESRPDLWSELENHEKLVKSMCDIGQQIMDEVTVPLQTCAHELDWQLPESDKQRNLRVLVSAALKDLDEFGESSEYYELWAKHGSEITNLVQSLAKDEIEELRQLETQWGDLCEELSADLEEYKIQLQEEYGISESTIDEEAEDWPTIK